MEKTEKINTVVLLGPTAVGKTSLGVKIARKFGWDIISADSRQVYKGLDLGSGKDLSEYNGVPYHLIDVTTLASEFNVYNFQSEFYSLFNQFNSAGKMPFVVGGTGMYVDSILRQYNFVEVPVNTELREELEKKSLEELDEILLSMKQDLHNKSDLLLRDRVIRAIEIQTFMNDEEKVSKAKAEMNIPKVNALVMGMTIEREKLRKNIKIRLDERIEQGMIEEVQSLHDSGFSWERLEKLGLEYRYVSLYLEGKITEKQQMVDELYHSICQFAKRQETWFRGMERKGVKINWLPTESPEARFETACALINENLG